MIKKRWDLHRFRSFGESYLSVLPILLTITLLYFLHVIDGFSVQAFVAFLFSGVAIGFGLWLFSLGQERSISLVGSAFGSTLFRHRKLFFIASMSFILGVIITLAEPDLRILARQTGWDEALLISVVSIGVGLFMLFGVLRILFHKNLQVVFLAFYGLIFGITGLINPAYLPLAFDSGAVVTGPLTIPFILSFGAGLALSKHTGKDSEDAFGLTALATAGPILSVLLLALFRGNKTLHYPFSLSPIVEAQDWPSFFGIYSSMFLSEVQTQLFNISIALLPLGAFFFLYDLLFLRWRWTKRLGICMGFIYSGLGLLVFLVAVDLGFLPLAQKIGYALGSNSAMFPWAVVLGALFGVFGVLAEPAVHVLVKQIETVSEGAIRSKNILAVMALSVGGGMALQVIRAYWNFSILYYFIPIYAAALALSFFVPKIYANIAFDSGSIASGPMAASFVMPFVVGFTCASRGEDSVYHGAFGTIAMVSAMPLLVIQLLGVYAGIKQRITNQRIQKAFTEPNDCQVIHFNS